MKSKKKEKLVFISPQGIEYQGGFLSPCADGMVLGTSQIEGEPNSHLTIIKKNDEISAHITQQQPPKERKWFPPTSVKEIASRFQMLSQQRVVFELSSDQLTDDVFYITEEFGAWFNALIEAFYQKRITKKEIVHILNCKKLLEKAPALVEELKKAPQTFFGLCKAQDILKNISIIAGFTNSRMMVIPIDNELIGVDLTKFLNLDFTPSVNANKGVYPIMEFAESIGIPQYFNQEIVEKKFLEKLLSKDNSSNYEIGQVF